MLKKVLLVDPPFHAFFKYDRWWYSYGCAQLAASLREKDIETFVYDADKYFQKDKSTQRREEMIDRQSWYTNGVQNDSHYIWEHFRKTLNEIKPDIIGVSSWTSKLQSTFKTLEICKSFDPNIKTCIGGYHATACPKDFQNNPYIDAVFTGPSEHTLPEWILNGCNEKNVNASPLSIDIKNLPFPDRESLLFQEHYTTTDMGMLMTSRGCPYDCTFCSNKLLTGKKYQIRTVGQVREEIEHIIDKYRVSSINVADANFLVNVKKSLEMAELFKSYNLSWSCEGRIDAINDDFVKKLIDCGCTSLSFGIETGSNKGLRTLNKNITVEQVKHAGKILNKHEMKWKCFFIVGFPHETLEDMENTRRFALNINASYISLNSFVPLPGTEIYNRWHSTFENIPDEIYEYNQLTPKASFLKGISPETYRKKFLDILRDFEAYNKSLNSVNDFYDTPNMDYVKETELL